VPQVLLESSAWLVYQELQADLELQVRLVLLAHQVASGRQAPLVLQEDRVLRVQLVQPVQQEWLVPLVRKDLLVLLVQLEYKELVDLLVSLGQLVQQDNKDLSAVLVFRAQLDRLVHLVLMGPLDSRDLLELQALPVQAAPRVDRVSRVLQVLRVLLDPPVDQEHKAPLVLLVQLDQRDYRAPQE